MDRPESVPQPEHAVERAAFASRGTAIRQEDLPGKAASSPPWPTPAAGLHSHGAGKQEHLTQTSDNVPKASPLLGTGKSTLHVRLSRHTLHARDFKRPSLARAPS